MLGPNRRFALGFNRDAHEHSTVEARMADGSRLIARLRIAQRRYDVQSIPGLPGRSQPSPEYERLRKAERARIVEARAQRNASAGWQQRAQSGESRVGKQRVSRVIPRACPAP